MSGNYSVTVDMREMIRAVDAWLHSIGALPAPPRGHTLEWCLEADEHSFTELMYEHVLLLRKNGFFVTQDGLERRMSIQHELVISWDKKKKTVVSYSHVFG